MGISIAEQIKCVKREIALRKSLYPKWTAIGRMKQETADREIAAMEAVLKTLEGWSNISHSIWSGSREETLAAMRKLFDKCKRESVRQRNEETDGYNACAACDEPILRSQTYCASCYRKEMQKESKEGIKGWDI